MKILLTGATGYVGKRLLPILVNDGHKVVCCVRDKSRFNPPTSLVPHIEVIECDLMEQGSLSQIPKDIDGAYYLVHSMSYSDNYEAIEKWSAMNFQLTISKTNVKHVVYLSGVSNANKLSQHLRSRRQVELELSKGRYHLTTLRAGIIIGSGSSSFEIIRDLVEKLPIMIAPKWLNTKTQPIAISDVLQYLRDVLFNTKTYDTNFDIGGRDVLTYKRMLIQYSEVRGLHRSIYILPVMTPKLSSYWLYFVTSVSYKLAKELVFSMKVPVVCRKSKLNHLLGIEPMTYRDALEMAFSKIKGNSIYSSWKDSLVAGRLSGHMSDFTNVPDNGCFFDYRSRKIVNKESCLKKIWAIGGRNGWYFANRLWKLRGYLDKVVGGVGLRRGRTHPSEINTGDVLDFWRVLYANKEDGRLLLYAEMKLPGEAWLEFKIENGELYQNATFRPKGVYGRLYWFIILPFHKYIFNGMITSLSQ